jgi:hypothetical protein
MMNNNYGFNNSMGMGYAQQTQQPVVMKQTLTQEEVELLRKKGPKFNFKLSKEEFLRAICTHKDPNTGNISLQRNPDGTHTCSICHETFTLLDRLDRGAIEDICLNFNDLFQTIKTMYGPVPTEGGRELYAFIGFINRMPDFYEVAAEYFARLNNAGAGMEENRGPQSLGMLHTMMNVNFPMGAMNNPQANQSYDPNYVAYLQEQLAKAGAMNTNNSSNTMNHNPGVPNPNYAPPANGGSGNGENYNPIGFVETEQTVQAGAPNAPTPNVQSSFRG